MKLIRVAFVFVLGFSSIVGCSSDDSGEPGGARDTSAEPDTVGDTAVPDEGVPDASPDVRDTESETDGSMDTGSDEDGSMDTGSKDADAGIESLTVTSSAFSDGESIPSVYTCAGDGVSPPLNWSGVPDTAESFVLLVADPDAPTGVFKHWAAYSIPGSRRSLPEGIPQGESAMDFRQARNDFEEFGYGPPCPPPGDDPHRYEFRVWALGVDSIEVGEGPTYEDVRDAASPTVVAKGLLTGRFGR